MRPVREVLLHALRNFKGDDLERAERAFAGYSSHAMAQEYGRSGQTCQEILDGYRSSREEVNRAIKWVEENVK